MIDAVKGLKAFRPNVSAPTKILGIITYESVTRVFPSIVNLLNELDIKITQPQSIEVFLQSRDISTNESNQLNRVKLFKSIFDSHGSDKASKHDYHYIYANLFEDLDTVGNIVEIGLGSQDKNIPSFMDKTFVPGAGIRAFCELFPNAYGTGGDIDKKVLFTTDRINTFFVDQTSTSALQEFFKHVKDPCDLIIDDGLHAPHANIQTMAHALKHLKENGIFVVEDIHPKAIPIWQVMSAVLAVKNWKLQIITTRSAAVVIVERGAA